MNGGNLQQLRAEILSHWQIQEKLLQSYRFLFLISQSILFGFASQSTKEPLIVIVLLMPALVLLVFWFQIGKSRGLDVSYFQMLLIKNEAGEDTEQILTFFKKWQKLSAMEKEKTLKEVGLHKSQTRLKMERYLPIVFVGMWAVLLCITFVAK